MPKVGPLYVFVKWADAWKSKIMNWEMDKWMSPAKAQQAGVRGRNIGWI